MKAQRMLLVVAVILLAIVLSGVGSSSSLSSICSTLEWEQTGTEVYPPGTCAGEAFNAPVLMWKNYNLWAHLVCDYEDTTYGDTSTQIGASGRCCGSQQCNQSDGGHCLPWFEDPYQVVNGSDHEMRIFGHDRTIQVNPSSGYYCYTVADTYAFKTIYVRYCDDPSCISQDPCAGGCTAPPPCYPEEEIGIDECGCQSCYGTPILVQLDGGRIELSNAVDGASFDMFGTGRTLRLGWPLSAGTAWLALDWNRNGVIDDGTELFGNTRPLASGQRARHGYEVLAELDDNGDGVVDHQDARFQDLVLWVDTNRDARSQSGELLTLESAGITALDLAAQESWRVDRWGNRFRYRAKVWASRPPVVRYSWDVSLISGAQASGGSACPVAQSRSSVPD